MIILIISLSITFFLLGFFLGKNLNKMSSQKVLHKFGDYRIVEFKHKQLGIFYELQKFDHGSYTFKRTQVLDYSQVHDLITKPTI